MQRIVICIFTLVLGTSVAIAETTSWMSGWEAWNYGKKMDKQGYTLMSMKCRDTNRTGLDVASFDYKLTFTKRADRPKFLWAVGSEYGPYEAKAGKEGYKRVSFDQFRRQKSGLRVRCGVWHR